MDPIVETIIWGVVWFFGGSIGTWLIYVAILGAGVLIAASTDREWIAPSSMILALIGAVVWEIFVFIQVILHIVHLVQLMTAGG